MSRHYLFGPVTGTSGEALRPARGRGECLTFGPNEGADLHLSGTETWDEALARLPDGWRPDFLVLDLAEPPVPVGLWSAPLPLVGLARAARRLWHHHAHALGLCDLVLAPATTADLLTR